MFFIFIFSTALFLSTDMWGQWMVSSWTSSIHSSLFFHFSTSTNLYQSTPVLLFYSLTLSSHFFHNYQGMVSPILCFHQNSFSRIFYLTILHTSCLYCQCIAHSFPTPLYLYCLCSLFDFHFIAISTSLSYPDCICRFHSLVSPQTILVHMFQEVNNRKYWIAHLHEVWWGLWGPLAAMTQESWRPMAANLKKPADEAIMKQSGSELKLLSTEIYKITKN